MDFITIQVVPIGAVLGAISIYYVLGWSKLQERTGDRQAKATACTDCP